MKRTSRAEISIIMGVYNPRRERLLKALDSIIGQTYPNWELLLYDDGSNPAPAKCIRTAAERDCRIVYIRSDGNQGLAYALNGCLRRAVGRYIARMDGREKIMSCLCGCIEMGAEDTICRNRCCSTGRITHPTEKEHTGGESGRWDCVTGDSKNWVF